MIFSTVSAQRDGLSFVVELLRNAGAPPETIESAVDQIAFEKSKRTIVRNARAKYQPVLGDRYMDGLGDSSQN